MTRPAAVMAVAAVFGLAMACFAGAASGQTVKVGVTLTYSGSDAALGEQIDNGIKLYEKLHKQELPKGVAIELIRRDDTGPNPDVAKRLAQELLLRDQVQILTGGQWTPNAMAVGALSKEAKVPFVVMTAGGSAVTQQSPYIVRIGWTLWQSSYPLGQWAAKHGIKTRLYRGQRVRPRHRRRAGVHQGLHRRRRANHRLGPRSACRPPTICPSSRR